MAGWETLGQVLSGQGNLDRDISLANASAQNQYRSAQTEGALENARKTRAEAVKAEQLNQWKQKLSEQGVPTDAQMGMVMAADLGGNYNAIQSGREIGQKIDLRGQIADPGTSWEQSQRNRMAMGDQLANPIATAGEGVITNLLDPTHAVTPTPLGEALIDQRTAAAGLNTAKTENPERFRTAPQATAGMSPEQRVDYERQLAQAKKEGTGMGQRTLDLPTAKTRIASTDAKLQRMSDLASKLQNDEALWQGVGVGKPISAIAGTEGAKVRALVNTLKAQVGFAVLQDMRDSSKTGGALGNISNQENAYLQNALAALDTQLAPEDFREQLQVLIDYAQGARERVHQAFLDTYPEAGQQAPSSQSGGSSAQVEEWVRGPDGKLQRAQ